MKLHHWVTIRWQCIDWLVSLDCPDCWIPLDTADPDGWVNWVSRQPWASPGAWIELQWLLIPAEERAAARDEVQAA